MDWAYIMSWVWFGVKCCFFAALIYYLVYMLAQLTNLFSKTQFIEYKIDVLLKCHDIDCMQAIRNHVGKIFHERGENAATAEYMCITGNSVSEAREFVNSIGTEEDETQDGASGPAPPHTDLDVGDIHEFIDRVILDTPPKRRRRPRKRK